jgi:hypothetical protein
VRTFAAVGEVDDQLHLYGLPSGMNSMIAETGCILMNETLELNQLAGHMKELQHKALKELAQFTSDAPGTWEGTTGFFGDRCQNPPFCLDVVSRAKATWPKFYFPLKYMMFWDLSQVGYLHTCTRAYTSAHVRTFPIAGAVA